MGRGKVKGQLSLRLVGTLVVRQRMRKALQCRVAAHCQWVGVPAPPDYRVCQVLCLEVGEVGGFGGGLYNFKGQ